MQCVWRAHEIKKEEMVAGREVLQGWGCWEEGRKARLQLPVQKLSRHVAVLLVSVDPFVTRSEPFDTSCSTPAAAGYRLSLTCPPILPLMMCKLQQRYGTKDLPPKCAPAFFLLYVPSELASVVLASDTLRLQMSLSTLDSSS